MKLVSLALLCLAACLPATGWSQWMWIDKDGRKVFSDQAPPPDIPAKNILRQPGPRGTRAEVAEAPGAEAASAPKPAASAPRPSASLNRPSGSDRELQERKKQAEAAAAEKKKAEEERYARERAENCERVKSAKAAYDSGVRISRMNAKGEPEFVDDATRAAESQRLQAVIERDCR